MIRLNAICRENKTKHSDTVFAATKSSATISPAPAVWLCLAACALLLAASGPAAFGAAITDNLAGYWKMDDAAGTRTIDSSGNGKDGYTIGAVAWRTDGYYQGALRTNGTNAATSIPALNMNGTSVTITAWIRRLNQGVTSTSILACRAGDTSAVLGLRGNTLNYVWNNGTLFYQDALTSVTNNVWIFVALAIEPSTGTIYVRNSTNGAVQISVNRATHNPQPFGGVAYLAYDPAFNNYMRADLDDVRVYDRALSISELDYLSSLGAPATSPYPPSGATNVTTMPTLTWLPGADALSHDVYITTSFAATNAATTASPGYMGNFTTSSYQPAPLANSQNYYWRVDEVSDLTIKKGAIWNFTTIIAPPAAASNPNPADLATSVALNATLTWTAGARTATNSVYFGTTDPPPFVGNQAGATYVPASLAPGVTYFWRIDEVNVVGAATGTLWSFTTALNPPGQASAPRPSNGALNVLTTATLSWTAGAGAASHEVYFGTNNPPDFVGTQTVTVFDPGVMAYNTTYYWQVDERNDAGLTTGALWSFTTALAPPDAATAPDPANGAPNVLTTATLSWTAGARAVSHDVYFGTTNPPAFIANQTATTYRPGYLAGATTYYWRIDERNAGGVATGTVWSFATEDYFGPIAWWKMDETTGTLAADATGDGFDGEVLGAATWLPAGGYLNGALRGNATDTATSVPALRLNSNHVTFSAWIKRNGAQTANAGIFTCRAGATAMSLRIPVAGANHTLSLLWNNVGNNAGTLLIPDAQWTFVAATVEPTQIILYLGGASGITSQTFSAAFAIEEFDAPLSLGFDTNFATRHFNGDMDDMRVYGRALSPDEMTTLWRTGGPALDPTPADGAIDVPTSPLLAWSPAPTAFSHDVYLGTDLVAIQTATTTAPEFQGAVTTASFQAGGLATSQTYYWRIDENSDYGMRASAVWRFTTQLPPTPTPSPVPTPSATPRPTLSPSPTPSPTPTPTPTLVDLAFWNFNDRDDIVDGGVLTSASATFSVGRGLTTTTFPIIDPAHLFAHSNASWNILSPLTSNSWTIAVDTTGYQDISLEFDEARSGNGPRQFRVFASADGGGSYAPISLATAASTAFASTSPMRLYDLTSVTVVNNNPLVHFQLRAWQTNESTGTWRIDNVHIKGRAITVPTPSPSPTASPTASPRPTPTASPKPTASPTPSATPRPTPSMSPTPSASPTPPATPTPTPVTALAVWNFDDSNDSVDGGVVSSAAFNVGITLTNTSFTSGNPATGAAHYNAGWDAATPDPDRAWTIAVDTTGYRDIALEFDERRNNTGPLNFEVLVSRDGGGTYLPVTAPTSTSLAFAATPMYLIDLARVTALNNNPLVQIQLRAWGAPSPTGSWRIDNVRVTGKIAGPTPTPSPTPSARPTPTASPTPPASPTPSMSPTPTARPTASPSVSPTGIPNQTPTMSPTPTNRPTPTINPTPTTIPTPTNNPTPTPCKPEVVSITRMDGNPTTGSTIRYLVIFTDTMTNVQLSDFVIVSTGTFTTAPTILNLTPPADSRFYNVLVDTGAGMGQMRLDIRTSATMTGVCGEPLSNIPYMAGEIYDVWRPSSATLTDYLLHGGDPAGLDANDDGLINAADAIWLQRNGR